MTKDQLERKVKDLDRRIKELEAQPRETHFHYPVYVPPYQAPTKPIAEPYKIYIGDPPPWGSTTVPCWPNPSGTITWSGGNQ